MGRHLALQSGSRLQHGCCSRSAAVSTPLGGVAFDLDQAGWEVRTATIAEESTAKPTCLCNLYRDRSVRSASDLAWDQKMVCLRFKNTSRFLSEYNIWRKRKTIRMHLFPLVDRRRRRCRTILDQSIQVDTSRRINNRLRIRGYKKGVHQGILHRPTMLRRLSSVGRTTRQGDNLQDILVQVLEARPTTNSNSNSNNIWLRARPADNNRPTVAPSPAATTINSLPITPKPLLTSPQPTIPHLQPCLLLETTADKPDNLLRARTKTRITVSQLQPASIPALGWLRQSQLSHSPFPLQVMIAAIPATAASQVHP